MSTDDVPMADAEADDAGDAGELLVWPWTGILATTTAADEDADAAAAATLTFHAHRRFAGVATTALQDEPTDHHHRRRQRFLLLHFGKSWAGLRDAMSLAFHFGGTGRREWRRRRDGDGDAAGGGVFGWAAAEVDLLGDGAVGRFLRESGAAARSVEDVEKDEAGVAVTLGAVAGEYERRERFLEAKNEEMVRVLQRMEEESCLRQVELKDIKELNAIKGEMNRGFDLENEKLRAELDAIKGEIDLTVERIQELKERRTEMQDSKVEKLVIEVNSLDMADMKPKASDHAQMLRDKHKEDMQAINAKVIQLEKQLEQKVAQESAICLLNTKLQAGENLKTEEYEHLYKLMTISKECLEQKLVRLENAYLDLTKRYQLNIDELQETRQEVIKCVESTMIGDCPIIGIKRMGELDEKPFHACKGKYRDGEPEGKAARLESSWQAELKNKSWNPFSTILVDEEKDFLTEDPKLRHLWTEYGDDVCNAAVNELWNFREGRKATMAEVVKYIFEQLKPSS